MRRPWRVDVDRRVHPFDPHAVGVGRSAARAVALTASAAQIRATRVRVDRAPTSTAGV
jgi:hypothetical protein